jgi:hypothetical protein
MVAHHGSGPFQAVAGSAIEMERLTKERDEFACAFQAASDELKQFKDRARLAEREIERLEAILEHERGRRSFGELEALFEPSLTRN